MTHLLLVAQLSRALWAVDLRVWHSSPRLEKNEVIFMLLSLEREQGITYVYVTAVPGGDGEQFSSR